MDLVRIREILNSCLSLIRNSVRKRSLARPRSKWENSKVDITETRCKSVYCIHLVQDENVMMTVMNLQVS